jgi:tRNA1Val (adenine37-N6)-methyltransferase
MIAERTDSIGFGDLRLIQRPEDFCYGVDAVLLADFAACGIKALGTVMDLGTGNGIIPLILSHKSAAKKIFGLEVQSEAYALACKNITENGLDNKISIIQGDVKNIGISLHPELIGTIDVVISNPPYMAEQSGLVNQNQAKTIARHETSGNLNDFLKAAQRLLKSRGHLYVVHRPSRMVDLLCMARELGLEPKELRLVCPKAGESPNILMVHFLKGGGKELKILPIINVYRSDGEYSDEILSIYEK